MVMLTCRRLRRTVDGFVTWRKLPAYEFVGEGKLEARPTGKSLSAARLATLLITLAGMAKQK